MEQDLSSFNNSRDVDTMLENGMFVRFLGPGLESHGISVYKLGHVFQQLEILFAETYHHRFPENPPKGLQPADVRLELLDRRKASDGYILGQLLQDAIVTGIVSALLYDALKQIYHLVSGKYKKDDLLKNGKIFGEYSGFVFRAALGLAVTTHENVIDAIEISVRRPRPLTVRIDKDTVKMLEKLDRDEYIVNNTFKVVEGRILQIDILQSIIVVSDSYPPPMTIPQSYRVNVPKKELVQILKTYTPDTDVKVVGYEVRKLGDIRKKDGIEMNALSITFKGKGLPRTIKITQ